MSGSRAPIRISVMRRAGRSPLSSAEVARLLSEAGRMVGCPGGEISVVFTSDGEMKGLNRRFRAKSRTTDVLSFPDGGLQRDGDPRIGDIVISVPQARRQAASARRSLRAEVRSLLIHGILHLLGYDHEVDGGEMEALEAVLHARLIPRARGRRAS